MFQPLVASTTTQTVVTVETREGERRDFVLDRTCSSEHVTAEFYDRDYDSVTCIFSHGDDDGSEGSACYGTWTDPDYDRSGFDGQYDTP